MANPFRLLLLPGDGIGPELVTATLRVFKRLCQVEAIETDIQHNLLHGAAWEKYGTFCRDQTVATAKRSDALLIGTILSVALKFEYSLQRKDLAQRIEDAVEQSLQAGILTADIGGNASTEQVCEKFFLL